MPKKIKNLGIKSLTGEGTGARCAAVQSRRLRTYREPAEELLQYVGPESCASAAGQRSAGTELWLEDKGIRNHAHLEELQVLKQLSGVYWLVTKA